MNPLPISESELHAYIDGLLPESRCAEIERYLSTHPEEAERADLSRTDAGHQDAVWSVPGRSYPAPAY
jgi:anti-sigma factor RsiW